MKYFILLLFVHLLLSCSGNYQAKGIVLAVLNTLFSPIRTGKASS